MRELRCLVVLALGVCALACPPPPVDPADAGGRDRSATPDSRIESGALIDAAHADVAIADLSSEDGVRDAVLVDTTDAAGSEDAAVACSAAETCPAGQGCVGGVCAPCHGGEDCRSSLREGCQDGTCGPCDEATQCAPGLACRSVTGECDSCRVAFECRSGEACVDGACAPCVDNLECSGGLCQGGQCAECLAQTSDAACAAGYGQGFTCQDGRCLPMTCTAGVDCQLVGLVCESGRCVSCAAAYDCLDALAGGYATGTLCVEGVCAEANCESDEGCPPDRPICGDDYRCRTCQGHAECLARFEASEGFVCNLQSGRCSTGNCYPAGVSCGASNDLVCGENFMCRACDDDSECRVTLASDRGICEDGSCVLGCQSALACTSTQVCGDDARCRGCIDNPECAAAYSAGYVCINAQCLEHECNAQRPCTGDRVCDQNACVDCIAGDEDFCTNRGQRCDVEARVCVQCLDDADCAGGGRICDSKVCRDCATGECGEGRVCAAGACMDGDCYPSGVACGAGGDQVCGVDFACRACADDSECRTALASDAAICDAERCVLGCVVPQANQAGQVCGDDHRFDACDDDAQCAQAKGDARWVCELGACVEGCTVGGPCAGQQVCGADHRCKPCTNNASCSTAYSSAYLCVEGQCLEVECNAERGCSLGRVCDATQYLCRDCESHAECGDGKVCDMQAFGGSGRCYSGECTRAVQEQQCGSGLCDGVTKTCVACSASTPCGLSAMGQPRVCDEGACVVGECTAATQDAACVSNLCNASHQCVDCVQRTDCGTGRICQQPNCIVGNCLTASDCGVMPGTVSMQVCVANICTTCLDDNQCLTQYPGSGKICIGGLCKSECIVDSDCEESTLRCVLGRCEPCHNDGECGANKVCDETAQKCVPGTCAVDEDCPPSSDSCLDPACLVGAGGTRSCDLVYLGDGVSCEDGFACTVDDFCLNNKCQAGAPRCDDGKSCTSDPCAEPSGTCGTPVIQAEHCLIDATCYQRNAWNPSNTCQFCDDVNNKAAWSPRGDSSQCHLSDDRYVCRSGACKLKYHADCGSAVDDDCHDGQCECTTANCSARYCTNVDCDCRLLVKGSDTALLDTCADSLYNQGEDPGDCDGTTECFGAPCLTTNGNLCTADAQCQDGHCECADAACSARRCAPQQCYCGYWGTACASLNSGIQDPVQCDASGMACYGGACKKVNGQFCTANSECGSNECECIDANCTSKKCSNVDCNCRFNSDGLVSCEGAIPDGGDDFDNTCGALTCDGAGGCNKVNGATCTQDYQCDTNFCECSNGACSSKKCSAVNCTSCTFNSDGNGDCEGSLAYGTRCGECAMCGVTGECGNCGIGCYYCDFSTHTCVQCLPLCGTRPYRCDKFKCVACFPIPGDP